MFRNHKPLSLVASYGSPEHFSLTQTASSNPRKSFPSRLQQHFFVPLISTALPKAPIHVDDTPLPQCPVN